MLGIEKLIENKIKISYLSLNFLKVILILIRILIPLHKKNLNHIRLYLNTRNFSGNNFQKLKFIL